VTGAHRFSICLGVLRQAKQLMLRFGASNWRSRFTSGECEPLAYALPGRAKGR